MTVVEDDAAVLDATVLEEKAKRQAEQARRREVVVLPDDLLPGVGGDELPMREVLRHQPGADHGRLVRARRRRPLTPGGTE